MDNKNELLKKLGFSDLFIQKINEKEFEDVSFSAFSNSTSTAEPLDISPSDTNKIIIDMTQKPQSVIYNSNLD